MRILTSLCAVLFSILLGPWGVMAQDSSVSSGDGGNLGGFGSGKKRPPAAAASYKMGIHHAQNRGIQDNDGKSYFIQEQNSDGSFYTPGCFQAHGTNHDGTTSLASATSLIVELVDKNGNVATYMWPYDESDPQIFIPPSLGWTHSGTQGINYSDLSLNGSADLASATLIVNGAVAQTYTVQGHPATFTLHYCGSGGCTDQNNNNTCQ